MTESSSLHPGWLVAHPGLTGTDASDAAAQVTEPAADLEARRGRRV